MKLITTFAVITIIFLVVSGEHSMVSDSHAGSIQKWTDANGKTHYGSQPPQGVKTFQVKKPPPGNPSGAQAKDTAILYSTSWCGYCKKARTYLRRNNIAFTEKDIERDRFARADYKKAGGAGVPFLVKGSDVLAGFRASSYDRFFADD